MSDSIEQIAAVLDGWADQKIPVTPATAKSLASRLRSLRQVSEAPPVLALETPRRMAAVTTLLALRFQWDGEAWTQPKANPAPPTSGDAGCFVDGPTIYFNGAEPTPAQDVPMWPIDLVEALRRIEGMGGPASYIARECLRQADTPAQAGAELPELARCNHANTSASYDCAICQDCGAFRTDSGWGIAKCRWFANREEAVFYRKNGRLPENLK